MKGGELLRAIARLNTAQLKTDLDRNLEGQRDWLIMGIIGVSIWVIGVVTLLTKTPSPSKKV